MDLAILIPILGILLTMIPVAGVTLVLTIRLAVKPLVEELSDALRESRQVSSATHVAAELQVLGEDVAALAREIRQLRAAQAREEERLVEPRPRLTP